MRSKFFASTHQDIYTSIALLLLRAICGYAFTQHGWDKIQNPLHWMGPESNFPPIIQALGAISEFCGGIALKYFSFRTV